MNFAPSLRFIGKDQAEIDSGGGCFALFGIPFFGAGIFLLLSSLNIVPFENANEIPTWTLIFIFLMGCAFTGVGAGILFLRKKIVIDRSLKKVTEEKRFLGYVARKETRLQNFSLVALRRITGDSDSSDSFPVMLEGPNKEDNLKVSTSLTLGDSVDLAAALARFLNLPCEDRSTDTVRIIFKTDTKTENQRPIAAVPLAPLNMRSVVTETGGVLDIFLPYYFPTLPGVIVWLIFLIIIGNAFHLGEFWTNVLNNVGPEHRGNQKLIESTGDWFAIVFYGFLTFAVFVAPVFRFLTARSGGKKEGPRLRVSAQGVVYNNRRIAAADVLNVDAVLTSLKFKTAETKENPYAQGESSLLHSLGQSFFRMLKEGLKYNNRLQIKTRRDIIEIPTGVSAEETDYLRALIESQLKKV